MPRTIFTGAIAALAIAGCGGSSQTITATESKTATTVVPPQQTSSTSSGGPCNGNPCIGDWQKEQAKGGTVVQCKDGAWSHAGGLSGACSHHRGESSGQTTNTNSNSTQSSSNSGGPGYGVQELPVQCGYGVAGSSGMTCTFAENAFYEYWKGSGGNPSQSASTSVWSAEAQQSYPLSCSSGDGVVDCTGTNSSGVSLDARFSQQAVSAYTDAQAAAYAASGKLGPNSSTSSSNFTPGDQNPNDASASTCASTMEVGPQSDCYVAQQVASDLARGVWSAPGSDTVSEGDNTITFNCSVVGQDYSQSSQPAIYSCVNEGHPQDWFKFEFT
jgi:hypothetical protein